MKKGIEFDITPPGEIIRAKALTAERSEQLNAIGFVWSPAEPNMAWEDRFRICMEYCETNGRWPSQSMGSMGEWVSKQRRKYQRKDVNFMKDRAPKVRVHGEENDFLCGIFVSLICFLVHYFESWTLWVSNGHQEETHA